MPEGFNTIMAKIAELAAALNVHDIDQLEGCWIHQINPRWTIAVNGHSQNTDAKPKGMPTMHVKPFEAAIWYNGWPAGEVWANGGIIAYGAYANEEALLATLEQAIYEANHNEQK